ncbi:MAG: signal peptidase I [Oscillospiraceae bacterium]|nr:signal peptidase I [Oscillospiraceae bacterium]
MSENNGFANGAAAPRKKNTLKQELIEWIKALLSAAVIVAVIFGIFLKPVQVVGSSMEPTLHEGDRLIVWKFCYEPKNGDPVILSEDTGLNEALVKRIIATEGQTVDITDDGVVVVDGEELIEIYASSCIDPSERGDHDYPVTVPENCIFVMGDNRNHSTDSRYSGIGFVDEDEVIGKVVLRILPFEGIGLIR